MRENALRGIIAAIDGQRDMFEEDGPKDVERN